MFQNPFLIDVGITRTGCLPLDQNYLKSLAHCKVALNLKREKGWLGGCLVPFSKTVFCSEK